MGHTTILLFPTSPATKALELIEAKNEERRGSMSSVDSKLSCNLATLTFEEPSTAFPVIQWDTSDDYSDSESVRSMDSWNSFFGGDLSDNDWGSSSGDLLGSKRSRNDSTSAARRLVRSKKIKSDLSSLARSMAARSV
jgi:hypothetical protein